MSNEPDEPTHTVLLLNQWGGEWKWVGIPRRIFPPPAVLWGERVFMPAGALLSGIHTYRETPVYRYAAPAEEPEAPAEIPR